MVIKIMTLDDMAAQSQDINSYGTDLVVPG